MFWFAWLRRILSRESSLTTTPLPQQTGSLSLLRLFLLGPLEELDNLSEVISEVRDGKRMYFPEGNKNYQKKFLVPSCGLAPPQLDDLKLLGYGAIFRVADPELIFVGRMARWAYYGTGEDYERLTRGRDKGHGGPSQGTDASSDSGTRPSGGPCG
jgi:hypothetical protein